MRRPKKPPQPSGVEFRSDGSLRVVGSGWRHYTDLVIGCLVMGVVAAAYLFIQGGGTRVPEGPSADETACVYARQKVEDAHDAAALEELVRAENPDLDLGDGPPDGAYEALTAVDENPSCFNDAAVDAARNSLAIGYEHWGQGLDDVLATCQERPDAFLWCGPAR